MATPLALNPYLTQLHGKLKVLYEEVLSGYTSGRADLSEQHDEMGRVAHQMHVGLVEAGMEPRYTRDLISGRGCQPAEAYFHQHLHSVEELLRFLEDPDSNQDPEDQTLGHEFQVEIFTRRWGRPDGYVFRRLNTGWDVSNGFRGGPSDKRGVPGLYNSLDADSVNYPEELPGYLEWLWNRAERDGLSHEEVQVSLTSLAEWISSCERHSPRGVFAGFK